MEKSENGPFSCFTMKCHRIARSTLGGWQILNKQGWGESGRALGNQIRVNHGRVNVHTGGLSWQGCSDH